VVAKRDEPRSNIEDLTDAEVYDAIRYMEPDLNNGGEAKSVVMNLCLYIAGLVGVAFRWLYR
jgi:hypothetical protein